MSRDGVSNLPFCLDLDNFQFAEKDDVATIQSLKDEIEKKNKEMDMMKRKDFDTLRKQNESISHLQREFDDFADDANEQIQTLTSELRNYKQLELANSQSEHQAAAQVVSSQGGVDVAENDNSSKEKNSKTDDAESVSDKDVTDSFNQDGADLDNNKIDAEEFEFREVSSAENHSQNVSF